MRTLTSTFAFIAALALTEPSFAADMPRSEQTVAAGSYLTADVVTWVTGSLDGELSAPTGCEMLIGDRWVKGDEVGRFGEWQGYAWYGVRLDYWYEQAVDFGDERYYDRVYVGFPDASGWFVTDDWQVRR